MSRTSESRRALAAAAANAISQYAAPGSTATLWTWWSASQGCGAGADLGLPDVALRLLLQAHVRAQQRVHRNGAEPPRAESS